MDYEGIIFDLDGTLIDSLVDLADSMNKVLIENKYPTHTMDDYRNFIGKGIKELVRRALPESARNDRIFTESYHKMVAIYREHCLEKTALYEGISEMLNGVQQHHLKMAILSNKVDELTKKIVAVLLKKWDFIEVMGARSDMPKKPDPIGAMYINDKMSTSTKKMIYVGDSGVDMETAKSAGMLAVGVLWGYRGKEELLRNGADIIVDHPMEILKLLA